MKPTQQLHDLGQSLWVDNITRTMLDDGTLAGYIDELSLTGQTSNPTIFDKAIGGGSAYDDQIAELSDQGLEGEDLFFELALTDLRRAAELLRPVYERTDGVDGRVSLEVSPLLANDAAATIQQVANLHSNADCNIFIKIPGTEDGDPELILIATGSDVAIAVAAHEQLLAEGTRSRVVSLPSFQLFDQQDDAYRAEVLPPAVTARISIEEASTLGWDRYVGPQGRKIGMDTFGSSAPLKDVLSKFGFTPERVVEAARELIAKEE